MTSLQKFVEQASRQLNKSLEEVYTVIPDPNGGGLLWFILFNDRTYAELELPMRPENWEQMVAEIEQGLLQKKT